MKDFETIRIVVRRNYIRLTAPIRRFFLKNKEFTIISNNCWAGFIYQSYDIPYQTPTIGLFFMSEDYILFLENFFECLEKDISFIKASDSKYCKYLKDNPKFGYYPIGCIDIKNGKKIEIHFLHYKNEVIAKQKWNDRKSRINFDKLIVKFNDQNNCTIDLINRFEKLKFKNKIFIGSKMYTPKSVYVKVPKKFEYIPTSYEPFGFSKKCNITKMLNEL